MPTNAVTVEAGVSGEQQNTNKPPNIFDPNAVLVYLKGEVKLTTARVMPPKQFCLLARLQLPIFDFIKNIAHCN